MIKKTVS